MTVPVPHFVVEAVPHFRFRECFFGVQHNYVYSFPDYQLVANRIGAGLCRNSLETAFFAPKCQSPAFA